MTSEYKVNNYVVSPTNDFIGAESVRLSCHKTPQERDVKES